MLTQRTLLHCIVNAVVLLCFSTTAESANPPSAGLPDLEPLSQGIILGRPTDTSVTAHFTDMGGPGGSVLNVRGLQAQGEAVQLGGVIADYGVDLDGNGRFDQLVVEVEVYVTQPGSYSMGGLLDSSEFTSYAKFAGLASAETYIYLQGGLQAVQLAFDGPTISQARVDGPYEVKGLWISDLGLDVDPIELAVNTLDRMDPAYTTAAYKSGDFETLGAMFLGQYSERGVDHDLDGRYESLIIDVVLDISTPGTYTVVGDLRDRQGQFVSQASWTGTGPRASLQFDGLAGTVGPYNLGKVSLLNGDGEIIDSMFDVYSTQKVIEAEPRTRIIDVEDAGGLGLQGILPGGYVDHGLDQDGDGLYDYLVIDVPVEIEEEGQYRLEGWLERDGSLI